MGCKMKLNQYEIFCRERHLEYAIELLNKKGLTCTGSRRHGKNYYLTVEKIKLIIRERHGK